MEGTPPPAPETVPVIPWEDRGRSVFDGFFETVKLLATRPTEAFNRMPVEGGIGRPLFYAIAVGWLGIVINIGWNMLFQGMWLPFVETTDDLAGMGLMYGLTIGWSLVIAVLAPLFIILGVFVVAAIYHLVLMMIGGANRGFEATVRVVCYAQTAQLAGLIPCCGSIIGLVWTIVLYTVGLSTAHRTTQAKALLTIFLPLIFCCVLWAVVFLVIGGIAGLAAIADR